MRFCTGKEQIRLRRQLIRIRALIVLFVYLGMNPAPSKAISGTGLQTYYENKHDKYRGYNDICQKNK